MRNQFYVSSLIINTASYLLNWYQIKYSTEANNDNNKNDNDIF